MDSIEFHADTCRLERLADPGAVARSLEANLGSNDWSSNCEGLLQLRVLVTHHREEVNEATFAKWMFLVIRCLSSLRSAVVRAALICVTDLVNTCGELVGPFVTSEKSSLYYTLLEKSSFEKSFVMKQARGALQQLLQVLPVERIITCALPLVKHNRPQFRAQVALSLLCTLERADSSELMNVLSYERQFVSSIFMLANDANQEARQYGRRVVHRLRDLFLQTESMNQWVELLESELDATLYIHTTKWQEDVKRAAYRN